MCGPSLWQCKNLLKDITAIKIVISSQVGYRNVRASIVKRCRVREGERERRAERVEASCKFIGIKKLRESNKWIID